MIKHIISFTLCFCCSLVSVAQSFSALNDAFITHYNAGRYQEALPIGLKLVKLAATEFGLNDINYAITNENVGNTYAKLEAWKESLPYLHEAIRAYTGAAGTDEVVEVGLCNNGIGNSHLSMGTYDSARNYFVGAYNYFINYPVDQYDNFIVVAGNLISVSFILDQTGDVAVIAETLLPVIEKQEGAESETYLEFLGHAGSALRGSQKFKEALDYYLKSLPLAQKLFGNTHNTYAGILEQSAECYRNMGQFESCRSMLQNAGSIYRGNTQTDVYTLANFQHNMANLNGDLAIFDKAILHYDSAISYMKKGGYEKDVLYATILKSKAYTYMDANKNMEASELLKKVAAYYEQQFGPGLVTNAEIFISLANNEYFLNQLAAAENHLLAARSILEKNDAQDTYLYARIFELEGLIEHGKGNSTAGIELCKKAELLNSKIFGEGSQYTASCLSNQGIIYQEIGDYVKAEEVLRKSFMVRNKLLGTEHPQTALSMANLAMVLVMQARYDDADKLLAASLETMIKNGMLATSNTQTILNNIALLAQRQGDYENAEKLYLKIAENLDGAIQNNSKVYSTALANLSTLNLEKGDYEKALQYADKTMEFAGKHYGKNSLLYMKAANNVLVAHSKLKQFDKGRAIGASLIPLIKKNLGDSAELLGLTYNNISSLELSAGNPEIAIGYLQQSLKIQIYGYKENLYALSERDQVAWWQRNAGYFQMLPALLLALPEKDASMIETMVNQQLELKGFILNNAAATLKKIRSIKNPAIQQVTDHWQFARALYLRESSLPVQDRSFNIDSLRIIANNMEQTVYKAAGNLFKANDKRILWQDIQETLKPGEVAIEYIRFPEIEASYYSNTIRYGAIIIGENGPPHLIKLGREKDIQFCLTGGKNEARETMVSQLYRTQIGAFKKAAFTGDSLYQLIWSPMVPYLKNAKVVHIVPDGLLHKVAFAALPLAGDSVLLDRIELRQYSSLRTLAQIPEGFKKPSTAALAGFANFNGDGKGVSKEYWSNLPGTQHEIDAIAGFLNSKGVKTSNWQVDEATEARVKGMGNPSPDIIHIATHGFFLPDPSLNYNYSAATGDASFLAAFDDPLLRSGIILAHANKFWRGDQQVKNGEDGILTAYELAQLNWQQTRLVVLSACETGLGDVKDSEGVFGLQRALKLAGVQNTLLSLWQVPDAETAELMTLFYASVLEGKSIRESFFHAQKTMRARYKPFAWAAFVLVE